MSRQFAARSEKRFSEERTSCSVAVEQELKPNLEIWLEYRRPVREPRVVRRRELTHPAGPRIEDPDVAVAADFGNAPRRDRQVTSVGCPRRILIFTLSRQLLHHPILHVDRPDLEVAHLLHERDLLAVGRPVRTRAVAPLSGDNRSQ